VHGSSGASWSHRDQSDPRGAPESLQAWIGSGKGHCDRRTASTPAMAAAAAKSIAKRFASYAHANPRLNQETSAIMVSSRTLASYPSPPLCLCRTIPSNK
jgi:hypothetical protein